MRDLPALSSHLTIPLNDFNIIVLGGYRYGEGRVQLYDVRSDSCLSVKVQGAFEFYNWAGSYPIAQCGHNKVVALVSDADGKPRLIQFVKLTNTITILDKFGVN